MVFPALQGACDKNPNLNRVWVLWMITKTRSDAIRDKLIALDICRHRIEKLLCDPIDSSKLRADVWCLNKITGELWMIINTDEERGKEWGWWW